MYIGTDILIISEYETDAINALRSVDNVRILPVISQKDFLKKTGLKTNRKFRFFISACAVFAILFAVGTTAKTSENIETKKLTSIYAVFPGEINPKSMRVFAVYSNGDERELSPDEYTVTREQSGSVFSKHTSVTVEYGGCSCSFIMNE